MRDTDSWGTLHRPAFEPLEPRLLLNGTIEGQVWEDLNGNGLRDPGELGLNGWTVELVDQLTNTVVDTQVTADIDLDASGTIDPFTESGLYTFTGVVDGTYEVRQVVPPDWSQTAPVFDAQAFEVADGRVSAIAMNNAGAFVVAWHAHGDRDDIFARFYNPDGSPGSEPFIVNTATTGLQRYAGVSINDAGDFVVTWASVEETFGISAQRYSADGATMGSELQISATGIDPEVFLEDDGSFLVCWSDEDGPRGQYFDSNGAASGAEFALQIDGAGWVNFSEEWIDQADDGTLIVTWRGPAGGANSWHVQRLAPDGTSLGTSLELDTYSSGDTFPESTVAANGAGEYVVVWKDAYNMYARSFGPDGVLRGEHAVPSGGRARFAVDMTANGQFVVIWGDFAVDDGWYQTFAQWFEADATPIGAVFEVSDWPRWSGGDRTVAVSDAGSMVALWDGDHPAQDGMMARRYPGLGPVDAYTVSLRDGQRLVDLNFGGFELGVVEGQIFEDLNVNGIRDGSEVGLNGWTVELLDIQTGQVVASTTSAADDLDGDGSIDPVTEAGLYSFTGLAGGDYRIRQIRQVGYEQTTPLPIADTYEHAETVYEVPRDPSVLVEFDFPVDLLSMPLGVDGATLTMELAYRDMWHWHYQLSAEGQDLGIVFNDVLTDEIHVSYDLLTALAADGTISFALQDTYGLDRHRDFITLSLAFSGVINPALHDVSIVSGSVIDTTNFGLVSTDSTISGQVFEDTDGNGARDGGEVGLNDWHVDLIDVGTGLTVARATTADEDIDGDGTIDPETEAGRYAFHPVLPGTYEVRQATPTTHHQTLPGTLYQLVVGTTDDVTGIDFGSQLTPVVIDGQVFVDANVNGQHDVGEVGLNGVTIELLDFWTNAVVSTTVTGDIDLDGDGVIDPLTESGRYEFAGLLPEDYRVRQVLLGPNWEWTGPLPDLQMMSPIRRVSDPAEGLQEDPDIAMAADGSVVVVWESANDSGMGGIWGRAHDASGTPVGSQFPVYVDPAFNGGQPGVAMLDTGRFVVTWVDKAVDSDYGIRASVFEADGTPVVGPFLVNTHVDDTQSFPAIATNGDHFVIVWRQDGATEDGAFGRVFESDGTPISGEFRVNADAGEYAFDLSVAMLPDGDFMASWWEDYYDRRAYIRGFNADGTPINDPVEIVIPGQSEASSPSVIASGTDSYRLFWNAQISGAWYHYTQQVGVDGLVLGDPADFGYGRSDIAPASNGGFATSNSPAYEGVGGQLFGADAALASNFTFVTDVYTPRQHVSAVGVNDMGLVAVTWHEGEEDDPANGIFVRLAGGGLQPRETVLTTTWGDRAAGDFGNVLPGDVSGQVFDDLDGDGSRGAGETGLNDWVVKLVDAATGQVIASVLTAEIDLDGDGSIDPETEAGLYTIETLWSGDFQLRITWPDDYWPTVPADGIHTLTLPPGASLSGYDFGAVEFASVSGQVYYDLNGNGQQDGSEPLRHGWLVQVLDPDTWEVVAFTEAVGGTYQIEGLVPGDYRLELMPIVGWAISEPLAGYYDVMLSISEDRTDLDFGVELADARIAGQVFGDLDGNGVRDGDEVGIDGWTVELVDPATGGVIAAATTASEDLNGDGIIDPATERGRYRFAGLVQDDYEVRQVVPAGWQQTAPMGVEERAFAAEVVGGAVTVHEFDVATGAILNSFAGPQAVAMAGYQGLAVGPDSLFYVDASDWFTPTLWELDLDTGAVIDSDPLTFGAIYVIKGLAYLDGLLYIQYMPDQVAVWDPASDSFIRTLTIAAVVTGGLTGAGDLGVLFDSNAAGEIIAIDPTDGSVLSTFATGLGALDGGLAYVGGELLAIGSGIGSLVYRIDPSTGAVLGSFALGGVTGSVVGLGGDMSNLSGPVNYAISLGPSEVVDGRDFANLAPAVAGDFNGDGLVDSLDIDLLYAHQGNAAFDLDGDGDADEDDMDVLIHDILNTEYGDINLDGLVDGTDLAILKTNFASQGVGWSGGDLNGSGLVDVTDLSILAKYFGFNASAAAPSMAPPAALQTPAAPVQVTADTTQQAPAEVNTALASDVAATLIATSAPLMLAPQPDVIDTLSSSAPVASLAAEPADEPMGVYESTTQRNRRRRKRAGKRPHQSQPRPPVAVSALQLSTGGDNGRKKTAPLPAQGAIATTAPTLRSTRRQRRDDDLEEEFSILQIDALMKVSV